VEAAASRVGAAALALIPLALGVGRFFPIYVAPGYDLWYQYRSVALYPSDALVAIVVVTYASSWAAAARSRPRRTSILAVSLALLALATLASVLGAIDRVLALGAAAQLLLLVLFFVAVSGRRRAPSLVPALCVAVSAQAALAVWQTLTQSTAPAGALFNGWTVEYTARDSVASVAAMPFIDRWLRAYGTFPHPNILGAFAAVSLAVLLTAERSRWRTAGLATGVIALTLSFSRAAWLALTLASLAWIVAIHGVRHAYPWLARTIRARPLVTVLIVVALAVAGSRLIRIDVAAETRSLEERQLYDTAAWTLVARGDPVGVGNVVLAEQTVDLGAPIGEPPHDVFLIALVELGLPGLVALLALFAVLAFEVVRRRRDALARTGPLIAIGVLVPLLALDHYLWTQPTGRALLVWALALPGVIAARGDGSDHSDSVRAANRNS
jgi:cell division protein FtsW (lipid II flippase)